MRVLTFASYDPQHRDASESNVAFTLLYSAPRNMDFKAGTREQRQRLEKLFDAFDALRVVEDVGQPRERVYLRSEGGEILLENTEADILKTAWESYAASLPAGAARELRRVDVFLDTVFAKDYTPDELKKRTEQLD